MIAPLYFSQDDENTNPYSISLPMYCGHCKRINRQMAVLYCYYCSKVSNKQFLCRSCDVQVHAQSNRRKHKRRLLVLGSGLHKTILYHGNNDSSVKPLDHVCVQISAIVYHSEGVYKEPSRNLNFLVGTSGKSVHIQIRSLRTALQSPRNYIFLSGQYCEQYLGNTRRKTVSGPGPDAKVYDIHWENETFVVPLSTTVEEGINHLNNIIRLQVFECIQGKPPCCRGQILLSLASLLNMAAEPAPLLVQSLPHTGRLSYSMGIGRLYIYLRIESFHCYIQPSPHSHSYQFTVTCLEKQWKVTSEGYLKLPVALFISSLDALQDPARLFEVTIHEKSVVLGRVSISVSDAMTNLSEVLSQASENVDELRSLLMSRCGDAVASRDPRRELEELIREELQDQWEGDLDDGKSEGSRSARRSIDGSVNFEGSSLGMSASKSVDALSASKSQDALSVSTKSNVQEDNLGARRKRHQPKFWVATQFKRIVDPCNRLLHSVYRTCCQEDIEWGSPRLALITSEYVPSARYEYLEVSSDASRSELTVCCVPSDKGSVVRGLDIGVQTMVLGEKAEIKCRYDFAYGSNAVGAGIPPRSNMVFTVEVLQINKTTAHALPIRFCLHRLEDASNWIDDLVAEAEVDEDVAKQLQGKHEMYACLVRTAYKIQVKLMSLFGCKRRKPRKVWDDDDDDDLDKDEEEQELVQEEKSESSSGEEDEGIIRDRDARAGARYMWHRRGDRAKYKRF